MMPLTGPVESILEGHFAATRLLLRDSDGVIGGGVGGDLFCGRSSSPVCGVIFPDFPVKILWKSGDFFTFLIRYYCSFPNGYYRSDLFLTRPSQLHVK